MRHAGAATGTGDHADPVSHGETLTWIDFLDHGEAAATIIRANLDLQSTPAGDVLANVGACGPTSQGTADGGGGAAGATADLIPKETADTGSHKGATGGAAFDLHGTNRGNGAGPDILGSSSLAA